MMEQISYRQAKKPCKSRLFPVDLDAPYRPLSHKNRSKHLFDRFRQIIQLIPCHLHYRHRRWPKPFERKRR